MQEFALKAKIKVEIGWTHKYDYWQLEMKRLREIENIKKGPKAEFRVRVGRSLVWWSGHYTARLTLSWMMVCAEMLCPAACRPYTHTTPLRQYSALTHAHCMHRHAHPHAPHASHARSLARHTTHEPRSTAQHSWYRSLQEQRNHKAPNTKTV